MTKLPRRTPEDDAAETMRQRRAFFALMFRNFLRENFASAMQVMHAFPGIHFSTAEKWWAGKVCPGGEIIGAAFALHPASAARCLAVELAELGAAEPAPETRRLSPEQEAAVRSRLATAGSARPRRPRPGAAARPRGRPETAGLP